jgi:hypothetical protein
MKFHDALQAYLKSDKSTALLRQIHTCGFLTVEQQEGIKKNTIHERAYVTGIMLESVAEKFITYMSLYTDKTVLCTPISYWIRPMGVPVQVETKKMNVTKELYTELPEELFEEWCEEVGVSVSEPVVFLTCWDPLWNRNASEPLGLFYQIHGILKHIKN